ncbi:PIG-L deacetylase family protein [Anabaena sp. 4-3]|uniref:PIG-L deacetylase family protein n=1 Tax=Anabaena sp. 4-3 TaxID=1811979 RepID=UPI00082C8F4F|nr:PIG-L deacetylase family protein [Anabaena sp. 4-3]
MTMKNHLQQLQKLMPNQWLEKLQYLHSKLLWNWLLFAGSQKLGLSQKSAMVFSPHQDDETFGCGGMIAQKRALGIPVVVVFLTNGAGAEALNQDAQNHIIETRKQEAIKALEILGVAATDIHFLAKADGGLKKLENEEYQQIIKQLAAMINYYQPEEVYVPHRQDCHQDHEATFTLVKTAIKAANIQVDFYQYPVWLFWRSPLFILLKLQDIAAAYRVAIAGVQEQKNRAIASYSSQLQSLPSGFVKQFLNDHEIFFKTED